MGSFSILPIGTYAASANFHQPRDTTLSRLRDLKVIARTSVMQYKDTGKSVAEIGRELRVGTVLEGSVRKAGECLRDYRTAGGR